MTSIRRTPAVVSIHDVAPASLAEVSRILDLCDRHGVRSTLLVIPGPWRGGDPVADIPFRRWLDSAAAAGHEVSLHGWEHTAVPGSGLRERVVARGCGEFAALEESAARARIERGLGVMERLGYHVEGFTPPAWMASAGTMAAAESLGLTYVTTHRAVHLLGERRAIRIPAVCQRPASPIEPLAATIVRRYAVRRVAAGKGVRIALHPADVSTAAMWESATALVQVASCALTLTYAGLVRSSGRAESLPVAV